MTRTSDLRRVRRRPAATAAAAAIAVSAALAAVAAGAPGHAVPGRDAFTGHITAATGGFARHRGRVSIAIAAPRTGAATRPVSLTFSGAACPRAAACITLGGRAVGTLAAHPPQPDRGAQSTVSASGTVRPLGRVTVSGTVTGTGFIARGREQLRLTITASRGTITITAQSGSVPGFTSP